MRGSSNGDASNAIFIWLTCVLPPLLVEIVVSLLVGGGYILVIFYTLTRGGTLNTIDLILFFYFSLAWVYSIYLFFKNGNAIAKSLLGWHIFVFRITKENPRKVIPMLCVIAFLWYFSQKPDVNTSRLGLLQARLENISSNLGSVNDWAEESKSYLARILEEDRKVNDNFSGRIRKFSVFPSSTALPNNTDEVERLLSEFYGLLNFLNSRRVDTSGIRYSLNEKTGVLTDNSTQLLEIRNQSQSLCQGAEQKNEIDKCTSIKTQVSHLEDGIHIATLYLADIDKLINRISELDNSNSIISPELRALWQNELEKRRKFDAESANKWLKEATDSIASVEKIINETQQINNVLQTQINSLSAGFKFSKEKYGKIAENIKDRELKLRNNLDPKVALNSAKEDSNTLIDLNRSINETEQSIRSLLSQIESRFSNLTFWKTHLNQLKGGGYTFFLQANNSLVGSYANLINQKKLETDNLYKNIDIMIQESRDLQSKAQTQGRKILLDIGSLRSLSEDLRSRNDEVIKRIESAIWRANLQIAMIVFISLFVLLMFVLRQSRKSVLNRIKRIQSKKVVSELVQIIENPNEFQDVRFFAIDILYNELYLPTQDDVSLIKRKVKALADSSLRRNIKVAARLREVAVALELRLTERRGIK
jgi:hypothetical protein